MPRGTREIAGRTLDAAKKHKLSARIGVENHCTGAKSMTP
jgi:hypothetical protein